MRPPNVLARLAGAQKSVLEVAPADRIRYTAMGGVLLTTAGVAGVSAAFALNTAVGLAAPTAVVGGVLWALVIFNLDRMLVVTITRSGGWWRNLATTVPRLLLALVIGTVISVPLVLRIFQPEIDNELQVMHTENLTANQKKLDQLFAPIVALQNEVDSLQQIASGRTVPSISAEPDVKSAQDAVDNARRARDAAVAAAQCEFNGTCGTGKPGIGGAYLSAKAEADRTQREFDAAEAKLATTEQAAQQRVAASSAAQQRDAQARLRDLEPQLQALLKQRTAAQADLVRGEAGNKGLLARLEALDRLSVGRASMSGAKWALFLLFMSIELLPVLTKLLMTAGKGTHYDTLVGIQEKDLEHAFANEREQARRRMSVRDDMAMLSAASEFPTRNNGAARWCDSCERVTTHDSC